MTPIKDYAKKSPVSETIIRKRINRGDIEIFPCISSEGKACLCIDEKKYPPAKQKAGKPGRRFVNK